jgi:hypothetical protein
VIAFLAITARAKNPSVLAYAGIPDFAGEYGRCQAGAGGIRDCDYRIGDNKAVQNPAR